MSNLDINELIKQLENEFNKNGKLSKKSLLKVSKLRENNDLDEYLLLRLARISNVQDIKKISQNNKPMSVNFTGKGGPGRNFSSEKAKNTKGTLSKLIKYFKDEKYLIIGLLISIVIMVVCQVITPYLQSDAIDSIKDNNFSSLPKILFIMLALYIILSIYSLIQGLLSAILSQRVVKRMRSDLFNKIINMPIKYFDMNSHGDIMSRMTNDVDNVSNTLSTSLSSLFSGVLMILGTLIMMFYTYWLLALISCSIVILTLIVTKYLSKGMKKFFSRRQILLGRLNGIVEEMVVSHKTVSAFSKEDDVIKEFEQTSLNLTKTGIKAEILGGSMGPIMNCINNIGFVIISLFGGYFAFKGIITIGVISAFIVYAKQFSRPINEIANLYGQIQTALASAERVFIVLNDKEEDKSGNYNLDNIKGLIDFKNVNFSYIPGKQVLYDFNLDVRCGHKVALVGATGSGKTTVVNLLMRFYDIDSGEILIDGINIKDINSNELRKSIGIVLQDTVLFKDTIKNNLKYANSNITDEEMISAAKECNCHQFIMQMKDGYDTVLSEGGSNLSQGQRQLLSICRAFLANPKILILDEATSSVDTRTEKHIQDAMVRLMKDKTSLIIAHRLSTILDADLIVVMDSGRIVEMGNHNELILKEGKYCELYNKQFAGEAI